jgi:hypothetical protein
MTPLGNFVGMSGQMCVVIGARNYEWLPYAGTCLCTLCMISLIHGIINGFPPYASHTYMPFVKNVHWCMEAIYNYFTIKMIHNDKTRNTVGKPFIIPCPQLSFACLDKISQWSHKSDCYLVAMKSNNVLFGLIGEHYDTRGACLRVD